MNHTNVEANADVDANKKLPRNTTVLRNANYDATESLSEIIGNQLKSVQKNPKLSREIHVAARDVLRTLDMLHDDATATKE